MGKKNELGKPHGSGVVIADVGLTKGGEVTEVGRTKGGPTVSTI
jgi:hypothetical protein